MAAPIMEWAEGGFKGTPDQNYGKVEVSTCSRSGRKRTIYNWQKKTCTPDLNEGIMAGCIAKLRLWLGALELAEPER